MTYPQSDKLASVSEGRGAIIDFLEWMSNQGYHFMRYETDVPDSRLCYGTNGLWGECKGEGCTRCGGTGVYAIKVNAYMADRRTPDDLVYRYYDIDPVALEAERRAMLDALRGGG